LAFAALTFFVALAAAALALRATASGLASSGLRPSRTALAARPPCAFLLRLLFVPVGIGAVLLNLAVRDGSAPAFDLIAVQNALSHDVPPEVLQFQPDAPALGPPQVSCVLEEALRMIFQHH
jgi:hypothetical protein